MPLPGFLSRVGGGIFGNAIGYGVGTGLAGALEPLAQAERNAIWPDDPNVPNDPAVLAAMAVQGVMTEAEAAHEAEFSGINNERFHHLFLVNGNPIAPEEALDLWNRGQISEADVNRALLQSRLKPEWVDTFKLLKRQLLQASELAEMVVQDVLPSDEATGRAAMLGIHPDDFERLVRLAGNPMGPQDTLSLWNRGIIDEQQATLALRQSRLKPEWIEIFKRSRVHPATTEQAVAAVVRQRIPHAEGTRIAAENGIDASTFDLLVNAAGRPIGIMQALTLFNRKEFTHAQVQEVVARSDVRTEYTDDILKLAVRYPPLFQISRLISSGAIEDAYAVELIRDQGYPQKLAEGIVHAAHNGKTAHEKELTKNEVQTLYEAGGLSRDDATGMIAQLGYSEADAALILDLAEFRRLVRYFEAVINRLHSQYVARHFDLDVVTTTMDAIGVPTEQREHLLDLWKEERDANVKVLTEAQVHRAYTKKLLTSDEATARLVAIGYSDADAAILLAL